MIRTDDRHRLDRGLRDSSRCPSKKSLEAAQETGWAAECSALDLGLRERVGQMGFLAALSGFRSHLPPISGSRPTMHGSAPSGDAWQRLFDTVTTLQPRSLLYWDMAAWHMA